MADSKVEMTVLQKVVQKVATLVVMWVGGMETLMAGHLDTTKADMTVEWKAHMLDLKKAVKKVDLTAP